jgi:hypothetical protein
MLCKMIQGKPHSCISDACMFTQLFSISSKVHMLSNMAMGDIIRRVTGQENGVPEISKHRYTIWRFWIKT